MSEKKVIVCDICGSSDGDVQTLYIFRERRMDPAGSMDNEIKRIDLCSKHMKEKIEGLFKRLCKEIDENTYIKFVDFLKERAR